jgi:GDPmannose 4,6-dehydratase
VIVESIRIKQGLAQELRVGNIDIKRDFGYAPKYVEAMYLAMVRDIPADYLVCSGVSVSLRDIIYHIFNKLDISKDKLVTDPELYRPDDIDDLYGNNTDTKTSLQWEYHIDFFSVLDLLLAEELRNQ